MANMTFGANLLPKTNAGFSLGDTGLKWNIYGTLNGSVAPILTKTYTGIYATADNDTQGYQYYGNVKPANEKDIWHIKLRIKGLVPGYADYACDNIFDMYGMRQTYSTYYCYNAILNTSYRCYYYNTVRFASNTANTTAYGHTIGMYLRSCANYTSSTYARTYTIELLECNNCTFTFLDNFTIYDNLSNKSYLGGNNNFNACDHGLQETGDANDTTTLLFYYDRLTAGTNGLKQYSLAMQDSTGNWQSFTTTNGTGTSKTKNTAGFMLGDIVYLNMGSNVASGSMTGYGVVRRALSLIDGRYTFNHGTGLTANKIIYIKGTVNASDGLFYLADTWYSLTLPSTEDGFIYIPLGIVYSDSGPYRFDFSGWHNPLYYKDGGIRSWGGLSGNVVSSIKATLDKNGNLIDTTYLKLSGGTMTGDINFAGVPSLHWNDGTYWQRIKVTDDSTSDTAVFTFLQSSNSGSSYTDLMTIKDNGKVVAATFVGALSGNATTATTATLLSGSTSSSAIPTANPGVGKVSYYYNVNNGLIGNMPSTNNANSILLLNRHHGDYCSLLGFSSNGNIYYRSFNGATIDTTTSWKKILDSSNYTSYTVTKSGTGASGTWGISVSGNAATATKLGTSTVGSATLPIYLNGGTATAINTTGVGISITGSSASCTGNAATATLATAVGNAGVKLYANNNNEINFGGTNTSTTLYLGYRATDSRGIPTKFIIGGSTGTADLQIKTLYLGSGTSSYISSTLYTGNAATASSVAWANITGKPSVFAPSSHTHSFSEINNRGEEYLDWGGTSKSGFVSPIGMSLSNEHSANRMAFINGNAITLEYSSDSGSTWTDYGLSASDKSKIFTLTNSIPIGRTSGSSEYTTSSRTRLTITALNGTNNYVYTNPKKMLINVSSSGSMNVLIEYRTGTSYLSNGSWNTFGTYALSGWSGWNDIPLILSNLGGGSSQTSNYWQLRLTFIMTSKNASYPTVASFSAIRIYGENAWTSTSTLGNTNHLYSYDMSLNATFPALITATKFIGNLQGNASGLSTTHYWANQAISTSSSTAATPLMSRLSLGIADNSSYVLQANGTVALRGNTYITEGKTLAFRPNHDGYYSVLKYDTNGNEALVLSMKNSVTSFIVKSGDTSATNTSCTTWTSLTPSMQVKGLSLYVNSLIASGTTPSFNFYVNGKIGVSTTSYGSSLPSTGATGQVFYQLSDPYYELPAGGTTGQVLIKNSNSDRDVTWGEAGSSVPNGGTAGLALIKNSSTNGDASWGGPYLPLSGGTMSGSIAFSLSSNLITKAGCSSSWIKGRDYALLRTTSNPTSGYSPLTSVKTVNGSWEMGAYNYDGWYNNLIFSYCSDSNYNSNTNSPDTLIKFDSYGSIMSKRVILESYSSIEPNVTILGNAGLLVLYSQLNSDGGTGIWINKSSYSLSALNVWEVNDAANGNQGLVTSIADRLVIQPSGWTHLNGTLESSGEIISTNGNAFRLIYGNYGAILRNDGNGTYLLLTNSGDLYGNWNNLRPITVNNDNGEVSCGTKLYGAVWNDYAEYRQANSILPGYCVVEKGDDTLALSIDRMLPGAEIISDTFGFAIGETDNCKTPIAASGRVLAYGYEDRETFKKSIGKPVCSGPNGTVSIMTDEEYKEKGYCAIGFVSAVPDYEEWGTGKVKVNGRIWIRVR